MPDDEDRYEEWLGFYRQFFPARKDAVLFVRRCEDARPPGHPSRLIMHQCKRLVSVARDMLQAQPTYHSLQVFLLLVLAEATAKLASESAARGGSRVAVRRFFTRILPPDQQQRLAAGLRGLQSEYLSSLEIADHLYDVRCDVAHEGQCWSIFLGCGKYPTMSRGWSLMATLTPIELHEIVVAGCIAAAENALGMPGSSSTAVKGTGKGDDTDD